MRCDMVAMWQIFSYVDSVCLQLCLPHSCAYLCIYAELAKITSFPIYNYVEKNSSVKTNLRRVIITIRNYPGFILNNDSK